MIRQTLNWPVKPCTYIAFTDELYMLCLVFIYLFIYFHQRNKLDSEIWRFQCIIHLPGSRCHTPDYRSQGRYRCKPRMVHVSPAPTHWVGCYGANYGNDWQPRPVTPASEAWKQNKMCWFNTGSVARFLEISVAILNDVIQWSECN